MTPRRYPFSNTVQSRSLELTTNLAQNPNQTRFWTEDEHKRFVAAIRKFGPKDVKAISKAVRTRTPVQVRTHAQKYFLKIARDRKKQEVSDSTEGTEASLEGSHAYLSSCDMLLDDAPDAAAAAAVAASGEDGTSAAAAAAYVAATNEQSRFAGGEDMVVPKSEPSEPMDEGLRFLGLRFSEDLGATSAFSTR